MEKNIKILIEKIQVSNLSDQDKLTLIEILNEEKPDIDFFLKTFYRIIEVGSVVLKLFDNNT